MRRENQGSGLSGKRREMEMKDIVMCLVVLEIIFQMANTFF